MFYTLKHADRSCSFEAAAPPFSKKSKGGLAKVACTHCRMSKLKCSAEPHSCQRCLAKNLKCQYPSSLRSSNQRKAPSPPPTPQPESSSASTNEGTTDDEFMATASNQGTAYSDSLQDLGYTFEVSGFTPPDNTNTLLSDAEYMDFIFAANNSSMLGGSPPDRDDIQFDAENNIDPAILSFGATEPSCSCFIKAVNTYEAIEVAVWGRSRLPSDVDNALQNQKRAIIECEQLLECYNCIARPAFIMLLVSMCNRILGALEDICRHTVREQSDEAANTEQGLEKWTRDNSGSNGAERGSRRGYAVNNRQLDDDDDHLVLQSLVTARVVKLERLIAKLDQLVSKHSWPAHNGLIRELQSRVTDGAFIVERA